MSPEKRPNWGSLLQIQWWITRIKDGLAFRRNTPYLRGEMFLSWLQGTFWIQTGNVVHQRRWRQSNEMTLPYAVPVLERQNAKVWGMFKVKHVLVMQQTHSVLVLQLWGDLYVHSNKTQRLNPRPHPHFGITTETLKSVWLFPLAQFMGNIPKLSAYEVSCESLRRWKADTCSAVR